MSKQQGNDFSRVQARFANRMKLTSTDVAEVIQKRLLAKKPEGQVLLATVYQQQPIILKRSLILPTVVKPIATLKIANTLSIASLYSLSIRPLSSGYSATIC